MSRLPDFLIIGAVRSGSTALFRYLSEHPSIYMAKPKEIRFFDQHFDSGVDWYADHFARARSDQRAGEATPGYLHRTDAIDRIAAIVPNARLIAILRDPVDRALSHYWMDRIRGRTDLTFEDYLDAEPYLLIEVGRYVGQLRYVAERFPRDHLLVLFYEDLRNGPRDLYHEACRFIGVDDSFVPDSIGKTINQYVEFRSLAVRGWLKQVPSSLGFAKRVVDRLNTRTKVSYPAMDAATRTALAERFANSNAELALWLDRDLPNWTAPPHDGQQKHLATGLPDEQ